MYFMPKHPNLVWRIMGDSVCKDEMNIWPITESRFSQALSFTSTRQGLLWTKTSNNLSSGRQEIYQNTNLCFTMECLALRLFPRDTFGCDRVLRNGIAWSQAWMLQDHETKDLPLLIRQPCEYREWWTTNSLRQVIINCCTFPFHGNHTTTRTYSYRENGTCP